MRWDWENQDYQCKKFNYQSESLKGKGFGYRCLVDANFRGAILEKASFEGSNLLGAQFQSGSLKKAIFRNTNLRGSKFEGADLNFAEFQGSLLHEASFNGAKLQGANFEDCIDIKTSSFLGAEYDEATKFPEGFSPSEHGLVEKRGKSISRRGVSKIELIDSEQEKLNKSLIEIKRLLNKRQGQQKFRNKLISNYQKRCAITGIEIPGLEAAHIKPYFICRKNEKIDPKNGLLLRADIHTLFDLGLITIQPDYIVKVEEPLLSSPYAIYRESIHNKKLFSVRNGIYHPGEDYLEWHYKNYDSKIGKSLRIGMKITTSSEESIKALDRAIKALKGD